MRLDEPIEASGSFWLPEEPDAQFSGVLRITKSGRATLELSGRFINFLDTDALRFVGNADGLGLVTLDQCYTSSFSLGGRSSWRFHVEYVLVGVGYRTEESISFEQVTFSVEGFDEWMSISGFSIGPADFLTNLGQLSIDFRVPDSIAFGLSNDLDMEFCFGVVYPQLKRVITEATIKQEAYIRLRSREPLSIADLKSLSLKIRNFLCFAIGQTVSITTFAVQTEHISSEFDGRMVPIKVYFQSPHHPEEVPAIYEHRMLFRYAEAGHHIEAMLVKWLNGYEEYKPTLDLYFTSMFDFSMYLDVRFTGLVQALEALHRRTSEETVMAAAEFNAIRESLLSQCPPDRREWLEARLKYDNELSLRQRLKRLIVPFRQWFGNSRNREMFVGRVVDTRNYLTHYDQSLADSAADGQELYELCEKLDALIQLNLLKEIGLSEDAIRSIVQDPHRPLKRKLQI